MASQTAFTPHKDCQGKCRRDKVCTYSHGVHNKTKLGSSAQFTHQLYAFELYVSAPVILTQTLIVDVIVVVDYSSLLLSLVYHHKVVLPIHHFPFVLCFVCHCCHITILQSLTSSYPQVTNGTFLRFLVVYSSKQGRVHSLTHRN